MASALAPGSTALAWPAVALWRRWRKTPLAEDPKDRRLYLLARLVALNDAVAAAALIALAFLGPRDLSIFNEALDPWLVALYAVAWLGVLGAGVALWAAVSVWRKTSFGPWARAHHTIIATSAMFMAWFFVAFHVAGTTLNY